MRRTIHYRQIAWLNEARDLAELLTSTLQTRPTIGDTHFVASREVCEVRHRDFFDSGLSLHIVTHIQGARKGVRTNSVEVPAGEVEEVPPPPNAEFVERELAVVIMDRRLGYVAGGGVTMPGFVEAVMRGLLSLSYEDEARELHLAARADPDVIAQLLAGGVDRLDLGLTLPVIDAEALEDAQPRSPAQAIKEAVVDALSARFRDDLSVEQIEELTKEYAHLQLRLGRSPSLEQIQGLTAIATEAVNAGDEFKLRSRDGKTEFTRDKLLLKRQYTQPGNAGTLSYPLAWSEIRSFLVAVN